MTPNLSEKLRKQRSGTLSVWLITCIAALAGCSGGGGSDPVATTPTPTIPPTVNGPAWWGFGRDAQHSAQGAVATQPLSRILWQAPVDLVPQYRGTALLIHYGSPVITARNTVLMPVKTGANNGFRIEARNGSNGAVMWTATTDYVLPSANWTPSYNLTLTTGNRLYAPGAGGKLLYRDDPDSATGSIQNLVFYGSDVYNAAKATYDSVVTINTPLTSDSQGNVFFGFIVTGANPAGLASGIARIGADGRGTWVAVSAAAADASIVKVATNSAPALSTDLKTLYVAVNTSAANSARPTGSLLALDSTTLATKSKVALVDPKLGTPAWISDDGTSSPTVGPDGDVFFGVLEASPPSHNFRGWLLHFDAGLALTKLPGAFGWDDTASVVPASMVPSYAGPSTYLLMSKYNNYGGTGTGDGKNRIAILDPAQSQPDPVSGNLVMREILTILGPTADADFAGGVKEWCINTAAIDPLTKSVLANSEDGFLYRWDMATNTFSERIRLNNGQAESYTPTAIGPDGVVYAINNAALFAVGR